MAEAGRRTVTGTVTAILPRALYRVTVAGGGELIAHAPSGLGRNFVRLDEQYPGSRFVLTVRPVDAWIDSRRRHVENNIRLHAAGEYDGSFLVIDEAAWRDEWAAHTAAVRAYFAGRNDFLEIDITTDPRWEPLCRLLGVPEPEVAFPWVNRHKAVPAPDTTA